MRHGFAEPHKGKLLNLNVQGYKIMKVRRCDQCGKRKATKEYGRYNLCIDCYFDIMHPYYAKLKKEHPFLAFVWCIINVVIAILIVSALCALRG